eukprot:CAMPEP_0172040392 /NCGR_PEP_ID=MMETSP1041-20130122/24473_1 /TAXON_ID=464988 /ORGANISM="Hemiselmis andersenii, Strain CCMP439" /LENGTH=77 /DNA_ID=CAMNT_0012698285 /DNA_START=269 /DNA_END=499 /DNA_ORIENTATION=+
MSLAKPCVEFATCKPSPPAEALCVTPPASLSAPSFTWSMSGMWTFIVPCPHSFLVRLRRTMIDTLFPRVLKSPHREW